MKSPKLVVYSCASLDGRLTIAPDVLLLFGDPRWDAICGSSEQVYSWIKSTFNPQVLLEGSGSFVLPGAQPEPLPPVEGDTSALYNDFLPESIVAQSVRKWFSVVDSRGLGRWMYKQFPGDEWLDWYLLILVSRSTPAEYLAYLQREMIPYLVVGEVRVDLPIALQRLGERLRVSAVVSTAGGRLNGALLRLGLVDEVCIEFLPALIGGKGTPALFDAPPLQPDENPAHLKLLDHQVQPDGRVRLHYQVEK